MTPALYQWDKAQQLATESNRLNQRLGGPDNYQPLPEPVNPHAAVTHHSRHYRIGQALYHHNR